MQQAKILTTKQIEKEVKKAGPSVEEAYYRQYDACIKYLQDVEEISQEEYAGYLFAHAAVSNFIAQKHNVKR